MASRKRPKPGLGSRRAWPRATPIPGSPHRWDRPGGRGRYRRRPGNPSHNLNNSVTKAAHEVSGGRNRNDLPIQAVVGSMICGTPIGSSF